jgi:hypothetical protein
MVCWLRCLQHFRICRVVGCSSAGCSPVLTSTTPKAFTGALRKKEVSYPLGVFGFVMTYLIVGSTAST